MRVIHASSPADALRAYRAKYTYDKRDYQYVGNAYHQFVPL